MLRIRIIATLAIVLLAAIACVQNPTSSSTSTPSAPAFDDATNSGSGTPTDSTGDNRGGKVFGSGG